MLPTRVRVLVIGGGIHGAGMLHDIASRGWRDCLLVEQDQVGRATSSKSSKLIHGGLRYLQRLQDFPLVAEGLKERYLLMQLAPDIVKPLRLMLPIAKAARFDGLKYKLGLSLYDFLAGKMRLPPHARVGLDELAEQCPGIDTGLFGKAYSYWDGQTDDLGLVRRVAASAVEQGGSIAEGARVTRIDKASEGFLVFIAQGGKTVRVSCRYLVNCSGPWVPTISMDQELEYETAGFNNKGSHLLLPDIGLKSGLLLEANDDKRVFFVLPWMGLTLIGTTESDYHENPAAVATERADVEYLLRQFNRCFAKKATSQEIAYTFSGLRWLARDSHRSVHSTSRKMRVEQHRVEHGILYTLFGGKLTSYRAACEKIGDHIFKHFGEWVASRTHLPEAWAAVGSFHGGLPTLAERFEEPRRT